MVKRNLALGLAAISLAVTPVAARAGTTASSVAAVTARTAAPARAASEMAGKHNYVALYVLGAITLGLLLALMGGGKSCQSLGVSVNCG